MIKTSTKIVVGFVLAFGLVVTASQVNAGTYSFTRNLTVGSRGTDVMNLQMVLNSSADTQVAASGAGSPGNESSYFGGLTRAAVAKFQQKNGITPAAGYVGSITRGVLNNWTAGNTSSGNTSGGNTSGNTNGGSTIGGGLTVMAAQQPNNSLAPASAARVPFTKFTVQAGSSDVTVNSVTVEKSGLGDDAVFSGLVLLDENGQQIGISKTLNSNHQAMVGEPFVVRAGQTRTLTVAGNMSASLSNYAGQVIGVNVVGVNTSATVAGNLPIAGALHTINATLTIGSATLQSSSFDPNSSVTKEIGITGYKFSGFRLQAGSAEKVRLWSVRFNQSGSASSNDLANVVVNVDGTDYPTTLSADGKYYTALFGSGIVVDKGFSKDIYIKGDVVGTGAAGRTIIFDVYKNTDIYVTGETYMYGITATPGSSTSVPGSRAGSTFTTGTPFFYASQVTVSAGSVTSITKANSVPAANISVNVPNQVLGGFTADIKGEPITVQSLVFNVATSSGIVTAAGLTNVSIYDENGAVLAGPVDATGYTAGSQVLTFTNSITFPIGVHTYTLKGKLPSGYANNGTITISTNPSSGWSNITGQTTGNTISLSSAGNFAMNPMTIKSAALAISVSATPAAQTIVAGTTGKWFADYQFDASQSGEDVRFSSVTLTLGGSGTATKLTGCQLFDAGTALNTGSNVPTSSATTAFTLDQSLTITKGTVKTLSLKCNVDSTATGTFVWGITTSSSNPTVTGLISSNSVTATGGTLTGQTMTIGSSGSLVASKHASSPIYGVVAANTTGNTIGVLNLRATNENVRITKLGLSLTGAVGDLAPGSNITVWDGATQVGSVAFTVGSSVATSTLNNGGFVINRDADKQLTIKADFAEIGSGKSGTPGKLVSVDFSSAEATGVDSGSTIWGSGSTSFSGLRLQKTYPTFTYNTSSGTAQNGTNDLLVLNVAASSAGDVLLNKLTFSVATTTATVSTFTFTGPSGNVSSSTPILNAAGTTVTVYFDSNSNTSDRVVPAGTTRTFTLRGTNVSLTGTNSTGSVTVALKADTAYPTLSGSYLMASTTVSGLTSQNVLWSPISTSSVSSATITLDDWTNGYGLPGCHAAAGLGTDCTARTVSK